MQIKEIRREKLNAVKPIGTLDSPIADLAREVLGYDSAVAIKATAAVAMPKLKQALADLEIEILNPADVRLYKMQKRHTTEIEKFPESDQSSYRDPLCFWHETEIEKYKKAIPDFVLNKAIQIKKQVPDCQIFIEELEYNLDPFLVVRIGYQETYYVEVWDEPGFTV